MRWRRSTTIVCQQWVELVTDYLEGALTRRTTAAIDRHLAACPHCTEYLAQVRATIRLTGRMSDEAVPEEVVAVLVAAFRELHDEGPGER